MTPFDSDFLSTAPSWLGKTKSDRARARIKSATGSVLMPSAVAAVPTLVLSIAMIGAVSLGPLPRASANNDVDTVEIFVRQTSDAEIAWDGYLLRLEDPLGRFPSPQMRAVRTVWECFQRLNPRIQPPQTAPTDEGTLTMVWDWNVHHLEVDVDANRKVGFFYSDRSTGKYEAKERIAAEYLPNRLHEIVKLLA